MLNGNSKIAIEQYLKCGVRSSCRDKKLISSWQKKNIGKALKYCTFRLKWVIYSDSTHLVHIFQKGEHSTWFNGKARNAFGLDGEVKIKSKKKCLTNLLVV